MNDEKPWSEPEISEWNMYTSSVMHQSTHSSRVEWGRGIQGIIFYGRMVRGGYFRYFYCNIDLTDLPS